MNKATSKRFWAKVPPTKIGECWPWNGTIDALGYGRFYYNGQVVLAHRFAWELANGPIPDDLVIDHLCRNRACQNMTHMELVTPGENVLRGESFSARNARKTHCPKGHPYAGENLYTDPKGRRYCRICQRVKDHKRYKGGKGSHQHQRG